VNRRLHPQKVPKMVNKYENISYLREREEEGEDKEIKKEKDLQEDRTDKTKVRDNKSTAHDNDDDTNNNNKSLCQLMICVP
jgi:hypothetical protein